MRKELLIIALGLVLAAGSAAADVLAVPEEDPAGQPAIQLPAKGSTMAEVQKRYGTPRAKQPTVGGGAPKHPPITRWDYDAFSVIFERDRVIDAVIPGAPPKIYHKDRLQPATAGTAPALPSAAEPVPDAATPPAEPEMPGAGETDAAALPTEADPSQPDPALEDTLDTEVPPEATPDNPYPDRPTPAEAAAEETEDSQPTPR